jgi:type I restriction enzyme, S subunit
LSEDNSLPQGWTRVNLADVSTIRSGVGFPKPLQGRASGELPFVKVSDISIAVLNADGLLTGAANYVSSEEAKDLGAKVFGPGTVLFAKIGEGVRLNRRAMARVPAVADNNVMGLIPEEAITHPKYLYYYTQTLDLYEYAQATAVPSVRKSDIEQVEIPLPPVGKQRRIVAAIEEQFSRLDAGVSALERVQTNLKRYRTAVLKAAVDGRLTEDWRGENPNVEPALELLERILEERHERWKEDQLAAYEKKGKQPPKNWRSKYKEPAGPDTEDLPELPEGWTQATVAQVARSVRYGTSAKTSNDPSGVPVLRMGNIQRGTLDLEDLKYLPTNHPEFPDLLLQDGDLLFNRTNSAELVGRSAVYRDNPSPCSYASYLIGIRLIEGCVPEYLSYFLNSFYGRTWIASVVSQQVGQANVNGTKLQALAFPLPPLTEQRVIVEEVKQRSSILDEVEAEVEANVKRAARLRQSILKRAFEGKLVPQDPTDEPASELLERIKAERERSTSQKKPRKKRPARDEPAEAQAGLF